MAAVELLQPAVDVSNKLAEAIERGQALLNSVPNDPTKLPAFREDYLSWESRTTAVLDASFKVSGVMTASPKSEFSGTAISLLDLRLTSTTIPMERLPEVVTDIREKIRVLRSVDDRLDIYQPTTTKASTSSSESDGSIFLVHGRDLGRRETVRRFLETTTDRTVIVLADQPNRGQDLLGKLLDKAEQAAFAVVLLTPDDTGGLSSEAPSPRARQNVVFELGLLIGLLGRDKVAALNEQTVELPTDFSGVGYIPIEGETWQIELARELKASGVTVSLDRII